jgi:hypothetical protein
MKKPMPFALLAGLACVLSAVSTFAMWDAVRAGHVASVGAIAGLGAAGLSGLLCILLARRLRWLTIVLLALVAAAGGGLLAAYVFAEPIRRWFDAALGWTN